MSESDEGVSVAATWQKAGSWLSCGTAGPVAGRVNPPAGTIWANVIDVFESASDDMLSHDAAAVMACPSIISARRTAHDPPVTIFIAPSEHPTRLSLPNVRLQRPRLMITSAAVGCRRCWATHDSKMPGAIPPPRRLAFPRDIT